MAKLSIGTAWTEAAAFVRSERRLLAPVVLGLITVPAVVASMVQPQVARGLRPEPGSWMIFTLLMVLAMVIGQLAIALLATGWRGSVGGAIGRAARRLPTLLLAGLAVMIPVFIAIIVMMLLAMLLIGVNGIGQVTNPQASLPLALIFVVTILIAAVRLLPLITVVANGDHGPITSLKRSFQMTEGNFWKLLGFMLLLSIAAFVAITAISAVVGSLVTLALGRPGPWSVSLLLIALVGGLLQAAFITIYTAMVARIAVQLGDAPTSGT